MTHDRAEILRDVAAIVIAAIACPFAWFGGGFLGCATQGFNANCAMTGVFIAPPVLILSGLLAAALTRGFWGYVWVVCGVVIGMLMIFGVVLVGGTFLPVDPITGVIATLWFLAPVSVGYLLGRGAAWFARAWRAAGDAGDAGDKAA